MPERRLLYEAISRYRHVASPGGFLNNTDAPELSGRSLATGACRSCSISASLDSPSRRRTGLNHDLFHGTERLFKAGYAANLVSA